MRRFVVTYFALKEGDTIESYRDWSLSYVRGVMESMPSVVSFLDFAVTGSMDAEGVAWDGCEVIEVTDFARFERDNAEGEGGVLAAAWRDRLSSWSIGYLEDLAGLPASAG
ncbi:hypothetical protein N1031_04520 [Herbiconiux moechotypicola]|uniref:Uncharacterized protein n=1 Tax=Herbiconiux moechotypicola TaxID=637393 RepID=A0ABN3D9T2_9MICO|nr:hypothetical protein [Herbiconiux moechotypicola]MCS5729015.1 hypothetical protein [Herbiconiux moechotypicola]